MSVILTVTATPSSFTSGNFPLTTMQNGPKWRFTATPSLISTNGTYNGYQALFATNDNGGLYLNNRRVELYNGSGAGTLVAQSSELTWGASQAITITVNLAAGTNASSLVISGAATGNGTTTFTTSGTYFTASTLGVGQFTNSNTFLFSGTISNVDDGANTFTAAGGTFALTGGAVTFRRSLKLVSASGSFALTGGAASFFTGKILTAVGESFALTGGAVTFRRSLKLQAAGSTFALTGGDATFVVGSSLSLGAHTFDFQRFGFANRAANLVLNTQVTGSITIIGSGGKSSDITQTWTNSLGTVTKLSAVVNYPDFSGYGTQIGKASLGGGTGQTFNIPVSANDENTSFATEILVSGVPRVRFVNANVANAGSGGTVTSGTLTVDGPAFLIADWWGSSPVVPPFSSPAPGIGTPFTAVPDSGFTVIDSYLVNNEFGEIQAARAVKAVTAAGTYNVTWSHTPNQGAQTWMIAVLPPSTITAGPGSFTLTGGQATFLVTRVASGAASGTSTASGVGVSATAGAGTAAGVSTVSGSGSSLATSSGTSSGTSSPSGVGASRAATAGPSAGTGSASGVGSAIAVSSGVSAGASSSTGTGASTAQSSGSADGISSVTAVGASLAASSGVAAGTSTAVGSGPGTSPASGTSTGVGTSFGIGAALVASVGISSGSAAGSGTGASTATSSGIAGGISSTIAVGASVAASVGVSSGVGTASGTSSNLPGSSVGISSGIATALGIGSSLAASSGVAAGVGVAFGSGPTILPPKSAPRIAAVRSLPTRPVLVRKRRR